MPKYTGDLRGMETAPSMGRSMMPIAMLKTESARDRDPASRTSQRTVSLAPFTRTRRMELKSRMIDSSRGIRSCPFSRAIARRFRRRSRS
jgi:hypothetical protein